MSTTLAPQLTRQPARLPMRPRPVRSAPVRPMSTRSVPAGMRVRWDRVGALLLAVAVGVWLLGAGMAGRSDADTPPADPVQVVIQPGDTVWDLARQHAPAGIATLEYVMLVEQHNGVRSGALIPGTLLRLPQS